MTVSNIFISLINMYIYTYCKLKKINCPQYNFWVLLTILYYRSIVYPTKRFNPVLITAWTLGSCVKVSALHSIYIKNR